MEVVGMINIIIENLNLKTKILFLGYFVGLNALLVPEMKFRRHFIKMILK